MKSPTFALALLMLVSIVSCNPDTRQTTSYNQAEIDKWQQMASDVTITRDKWGIAHIYGRTDADTVFGTLYAQAEDDFNRVETNYINAIGRLAEAEGEQELYRDLRMKLFIDPADMQQQYDNSPAWLQSLIQ